MSGDVIELKTRLADAPPLALHERRGDECKHVHKVLMDETRRVACSDCGADDLDPFEVLCQMAKEWKSWKWQWEQLQKAKGDIDDHERGVWERRRDRHMKSRPDHVLDYSRTGWQRGECEECWTIISRGRRYLAPPKELRP
jgi:hypothetical protein